MKALSAVDPTHPGGGAHALARSKRRYVYGGGNAKYFHLAGTVSIHWRDGRFRHATAHIPCANNNFLTRPTWTDERPRHLAPCPHCFDVVPRGAA